MSTQKQRRSGIPVIVTALGVIVPVVSAADEMSKVPAVTAMSTYSPFSTADLTFLT